MRFLFFVAKMKEHTKILELRRTNELYFHFKVFHAYTMAKVNWNNVDETWALAENKNNKERCVSSSSTFVIFFSCSLLFGLAYFCADRNSIRQSSIYLFEIEENEHTYCVPIGLTIFVVCLFVFTLASPFFSSFFCSPFILSLCVRLFFCLYFDRVNFCVFISFCFYLLFKQIDYSVRVMTRLIHKNCSVCQSHMNDGRASACC